MYFLRLFGSVTVTSHSGPLTGTAVQPRALALLALLAAHRQGCSRDKLVGILWPERDDVRARHSLADVAYQIRKSLGEDTIVTSGDTLLLNDRVVTSDVGAFLAALELGDLEQAVQQYGGAFCAGFFGVGTPEFERWVGGQRLRFGDDYASALESMVSASEAREDWVTAVKWWRRLQTHDPYNSRFVLGLIRALSASGDPANARLALAEHERLLLSDLDMSLPAELRTQAERLLERTASRDDAEDVSVKPPNTARAEASVPVEPELLPRIPTPAGPPRALRVRLTSWSVALVALAAAALWLQARTRMSRYQLLALAVLPCESATDVPNELSLGDRWTDELIGKLARVRDLRPKDWSSVHRYRDTAKSASEIGDELNAGALVRCQVSEGPEEVRITVWLVRTGDETLLWTETFREPAGPDAVNAVQSAAAAGIARFLGASDRDEDMEPVSRPMTLDPEALRLYRLGSHFFDLQDPAGFRRSITSFDSAISRDSAFADAYVGLAQTLIFLGDMVGQPTSEYYPYAARLLRKATAIDGSIARAHSWLALYLLEYTYDWEGAEAEHRRALELNPGSSEVHLWHGWHLQITGPLEAAIAEFRTAVALDPVAVVPRIQLARALAFARQLDRASEENRQGWELQPDNPAFAHNQAIIDLLRGLPDSARVVLQRAGNPSDWVYGPLYGLAGLPDVTRSILDTLIALDHSAGVDPLAIAVQYLALGNEDEALDWLESAYASRSGLLPYMLGPHIFVDPLRGNARFEALRNRVGFGRESYRR